MSIAVDQPIPDFTAPATGGEITLSKLRGKKVVLYFYPKDNTPGCTTEGLQFRDQSEGKTQAAAMCDKADHGRPRQGELAFTQPRLDVGDAHAGALQVAAQNWLPKPTSELMLRRPSMASHRL